MGEGTFLGMVYGSPRSLEEGERLGSKQGRPMNRERCEHTTYPVEVLHVDGGKKKIACCLGCGRTGVREVDGGSHSTARNTAHSLPAGKKKA